MKLTITDDNKIILDIFKNTAHELDIKTAVEICALVPIRCIRIQTETIERYVRDGLFIPDLVVLVQGPQESAPCNVWNLRRQSASLSVTETRQGYGLFEPIIAKR